MSRAPTGTSISTTGPERRSRLTPARESEVFDTVIELLREVGYDSLTMDKVAARARTSKATLYRQWQGKPRLVIHAIGNLRPGHMGGTDTGSLVGDLHTVARNLARFAAENGSLMASMNHAVLANPDLGAILREVIIAPERQAFEDIVGRAVARGELDHPPASTRYCGPILFHASMNRPLCDGLPATEEYLISVVDTVILPSLRHS